jgi:hypothetical protein
MGTRMERRNTWLLESAPLPVSDQVVTCSLFLTFFLNSPGFSLSLLMHASFFLIGKRDIDRAPCKSSEINMSGSKRASWNTEIENPSGEDSHGREGGSY